MDGKQLLRVRVPARLGLPSEEPHAHRLPLTRSECPHPAGGRPALGAQPALRRVPSVHGRRRRNRNDACRRQHSRCHQAQVRATAQVHAPGTRSRARAGVWPGGRWKKGFPPNRVYFYWVCRHAEVASFQWFIAKLTNLMNEVAHARKTGNIEVRAAEKMPCSLGCVRDPCSIAHRSRRSRSKTWRSTFTLHALTRAIWTLWSCWKRRCRRKTRRCQFRRRSPFASCGRT